MSHLRTVAHYLSRRFAAESTRHPFPMGTRKQPQSPALASARRARSSQDYHVAELRAANGTIEAISTCVVITPSVNLHTCQLATLPTTTPWNLELRNWNY